jgi:hypothetical protein
MKKETILAQFPLAENVQYTLRDKDGNIKQLWNDNKLCQFLLKHNLLSPLWINNPIHKSLLSPFLGSLADSKVVANLVTNAGKAGVSSRINGAGAAAAFTATGIGTGTTAVAAGDTTLETEKKADGTAASGVHAIPTASNTASSVTTIVTNDTAQLVGTISFTATLAVTESGVFNADTNGTLLCRQTFTAVNVVSGDSLQITWKVKAA